MQGNNIYEIANSIKNKEMFKNDINQIFSIISNTFKEKYITKIQDDINFYMDKSRENPSKEVVLLNAIKPFINGNLDNIIHAMTNVSAISTLLDSTKSSDRGTVLVNSLDASVKKDGVYDIDENCFLSISNSKKNSSYMMLILIFYIYFSV